MFFSKLYLIGSLRSSHPFQEVFPSPLAAVSSDLSFLQSPRLPSDRHQRSPPSRFCLSFLQVAGSVLPSSLPHREWPPRAVSGQSLQSLLVGSHFCCAAASAVEPEAEDCQHPWKPRVVGGRGWRGWRALASYPWPPPRGLGGVQNPGESLRLPLSG